MKKFIKIVSSIALVASTIVPSTFLISTAALAKNNTQRFHECRQLRNSGTLKWYGIASGTLYDGGGRNGYSGFHVKSCHQSKLSCDRWIRNIYYEIRELDDLRTAYCKPAYR